MPNIKVVQNGIIVHYGSETIQNIFGAPIRHEKYCFEAHEFWKMSSLQNFSIISINTRDKHDNCKDLLKLNQKFKTEFNYLKDVCFQIKDEGLIWTLAVMASKKGGLALKIYITNTEGTELGQWQTGQEDDTQLRGVEGTFDKLNKKLNEMVKNSQEEIYPGYTIAKLVRYLYEQEKIKIETKAQNKPFVVEKFYQGCYYITSYHHNVYQGNFKLIPWYNNHYLMLPSKLAVLQSMKVNTGIQVQSSIIGTVNSSLWINDISKLPLPQKEKLIQDWVPCFSQFLHGTGVLNYGYPPQGVRYDIIENSADLRNLEDYIRYILS